VKGRKGFDHDRCSFCREVGHTKQHCPKLNFVKAKLQEIGLDHRLEWIQYKDYERLQHGIPVEVVFGRK
jgi:hypothetical protein